MTDDTQPIATRLLDLPDGGQVVVELYGPSPDGDDFQCGYRITGLGSEKVKFAYGVDSMQALLLAMERIGTDLYTSDAAKAGQLRWLGQLNLGFPVPTTIEDLVPKTG